MTERCDRRRVEPAGSYRSLAVYVLKSSFVGDEAFTSVSCMQTDLLRKREEFG